MKNAILAGSIAGALLVGANANANDGISSDRLIARVTAEEQYREKVTKNVKGIITAFIPEDSGLEIRKFDGRVVINNGIDQTKVGGVTVGIYYPIQRTTFKGMESGTYFGLGYTRHTGSGNSVPGIIDNTRKGFEVQLRKEWRF